MSNETPTAQAAKDATGQAEIGGLIATRFQYRTEFERCDIRAVTFDRLASPFYEGERWAVRRGSECLSTAREWEYEPLPSSRDDAFYARCRFESLPIAVAAFKASSVEPKRPKSDSGRTF